MKLARNEDFESLLKMKELWSNRITASVQNPHWCHRAFVPTNTAKGKHFAKLQHSFV